MKINLFGLIITSNPKKRFQPVLDAMKPSLVATVNNIFDDMQQRADYRRVELHNRIMAALAKVAEQAGIPEVLFYILFSKMIDQMLELKNPHKTIDQIQKDTVAAIERARF